MIIENVLDYRLGSGFIFFFSAKISAAESTFRHQFMVQEIKGKKEDQQI